MNNLLIICGPTASGKSRLALELAQVNNGVIINADSRQLYEELPIITASPSAIHRNIVPHLLYNCLSPLVEFSVADYLEAAVREIETVINSNRLPIIVGGSGMYISALLYGISHIPNIDPEIRQEVVAMVKEKGIGELYHNLHAIDATTAAKLKTNDTYRIIRAYEVIRQTGNSISYYQNLEHEPPLSKYNIKILYLLPGRKHLYDNCNKRLINIIANNALEKEIRRFNDKYPNLTTGPSKALGVAELTQYFNGNLPLATVINLIQTKTRQYAKRQITWFNNQLKLEKVVIKYSDLQTYECATRPLINSLANIHLETYKTT